jgi:hypothetical protein
MLPAIGFVTIHVREIYCYGDAIGIFLLKLGILIAL